MDPDPANNNPIVPRVYELEEDPYNPENGEAGNILVQMKATRPTLYFFQFPDGSRQLWLNTLDIQGEPVQFLAFSTPVFNPLHYYPEQNLLGVWDGLRGDWAFVSNKHFGYYWPQIYSIGTMGMMGGGNRNRKSKKTRRTKK